MSAAAQSAEARTKLYHRLNRRNRFVSFLRLFVPIAGGLVMAYFLAQIALSRFGDRLEVGPIIIDRETVGFEFPRYSGVTEEGTVYEVEAEKAVTPIGTSDAIDLANASLILKDPDRPVTTAVAGAAVMNLEASRIEVPGAVDVTDTRGTVARMFDSTLFWDTQQFVAEGPVHVEYHNGIVIDAQGMTYDGQAETWQFNRVFVQIPAELKE